LRFALIFVIRNSMGGKRTAGMGVV
jgi:hypothetical protein